MQRWTNDQVILASTGSFSAAYAAVNFKWNETQIPVNFSAAYAAVNINKTGLVHWRGFSAAYAAVNAAA